MSPFILWLGFDIAQDIRDARGVHRAMLEDMPVEVFHLAAMVHVRRVRKIPRGS